MITVFWGQCCKTLYGRNLQIFVIKLGYFSLASISNLVLCLRVKPRREPFRCSNLGWAPYPLSQSFKAFGVSLKYENNFYVAMKRSSLQKRLSKFYTKLSLWGLSYNALIVKV
jgi:hypothetical protein